MKLFLSICTVVGIFIAMSSTALAHPGNTAADGGHYCWTNCEYWGEVYGERHFHGTAAEPEYDYYYEEPYIGYEYYYEEPEPEYYYEDPEPDPEYRYDAESDYNYNADLSSSESEDEESDAKSANKESDDGSMWWWLTPLLIYGFFGLRSLFTND